MDTIVAGKAQELTGLDQDTIVEQGGNGALEIIAWILMAGCLPGVRGEHIYYEPISEWITDLGGLALQP